MKSAEGSLGRVFVLRLENGDRLPECIERFAAEKNIKSAYCALVGAIGSGSIVVGPVDEAMIPPQVMQADINGAHESVGFGLLAPDAGGAPQLHMHAAFGRGGSAKAGCIRPGIDVWTTGEFLIIELLGMPLARRRDPATGFELLAVD
jgi:predicted DNA-binding protein with PD1-like motif